MVALIKLPFKLLSLPLIAFFVFVRFLVRILSHISGYILSPLILFILGCGVYTVITRQWNHVLLIGIVEAICLSALFGTVLIETFLDWCCSILKGFVRS